jgi:hypothetical protein
MEVSVLFTEKDRKLEASWKKMGVFRPLQESSLPLFEQALLITCFDARYFLRWYRQLVDIASQRQKQESPQLFPLILGGSPLVMDPSSPIHNKFDHRGATDCSLGLAKANGCLHATIIGHYPCKAGEDCGIGLLENVALTVAGGRRLIRDGVETATLFDLKEQKDAPCNPWHLDASAFQEWCLSHQPEILNRYPGIRRGFSTPALQ